MLNKITLAAAMTISVACAALAANENDYTGGYRRLGPGGVVTDGVNPVFHRSLRGAAGYDYGYAPGNAYDYAAPGLYMATPESSDVAYCMARFKSYDPASGTYLGYDGIRHPCP